MTRYCCVPFCKSTNRDKTLSFFEFPSNMGLRELWIRNIARKDPETNEYWLPRDTSVVCSLHFEEGCVRKILKKKMLLPGSVPCIFPGYPEYLLKIQSASRKRYTDSSDLKRRKIRKLIEKSNSAFSSNLEDTSPVFKKASLSYSKPHFLALKANSDPTSDFVSSISRNNAMCDSFSFVNTSNEFDTVHVSEPHSNQLLIPDTCNGITNTEKDPINFTDNTTGLEPQSQNQNIGSSDLGVIKIKNLADIAHELGKCIYNSANKSSQKTDSSSYNIIKIKAPASVVPHLEKLHQDSNNESTKITGSPLFKLVKVSSSLASLVHESEKPNIDVIKPCKNGGSPPFKILKIRPSSTAFIPESEEQSVSKSHKSSGSSFKVVKVSRPSAAGITHFGKPATDSYTKSDRNIHLQSFNEKDLASSSAFIMSKSKEPVLNYSDSAEPFEKPSSKSSNVIKMRAPAGTFVPHLNELDINFNTISNQDVNFSSHLKKNKMQALIRKLHSAQRQCRRLKSKNLVLKEEKSIYENECKYYKRMAENSYIMFLEEGVVKKNQKALFLKDQLIAFKKKKAVWSDLTIRHALVLYHKYPAAYKMLREMNILTLPSRSTLERHIGSSSSVFKESDDSIQEEESFYEELTDSSNQIESTLFKELVYIDQEKESNITKKSTYRNEEIENTALNELVDSNQEKESHVVVKETFDTIIEESTV